MRVNILRLLILALALTVCTTANGKGIISLDKSTHDFGVILESDGNVSHIFTFTNTGDEPIIISNVSVSCGCTTPEWTKSPILPGKKGSVTATYLVAGRPGPFDKGLVILSNAQESSVSIYIKGEVVKKMPTIEEQYPIAVGKSLRLATSGIPFARITKGATKTATLAAYNSGSEPVKITFEKVPAHLKLRVEPTSIAPNEKGVITCTYETAMKNGWGFVSDIVSFKVNDKKIDNATLKISATILDDFSQLTTEQRLNAPYPQFRVTTQSFDNILKGSLINTTFILTNSGESPMTIRKVASENSAVTASAAKTTVKVGESIEIKVTVDTSTFDTGAFSVPISIFSNSPRNPQANIMVTGSIINW